MKKSTNFKETLGILGEAYYQTGFEGKEATALNRITLKLQIRIAISVFIFLGNSLYFWNPNAKYANILVLLGALFLGAAFLRTCGTKNLGQFISILFYSTMAGIVWITMRADAIDVSLGKEFLVVAFIVSSLMSAYYLAKSFFTSK